MQSRKKGNALGVDLSHWNHDVDFKKVKESGISFAILKATEGSNFIDDYLGKNYTGCKQNDIGIGLYHFMRAETTEEAKKEADYFIDVLDNLGGISAINIPPALDIEHDTPLPRGLVTAIAKTWLERIENYYGVTPMLYSYPWYIDTYLDSSLDKYPLWLASYGNDSPKDMGGWNQWEFLQVSDCGNVPGIVGNVDINEFRGTESDLMYKMKAEDAQQILHILGGIYNSGLNPAKAHYLADEVRKAAGMPIR